MSTLIRVSIRNEQIRLFNIINKDSSILYQRLEEYVLEDSLSLSERIFIHFICLSNFRAGDLSYYWKHVDFIITNWRQLDPNIIGLIDTDLYVGSLWLPINNLLTRNDLDLWFKYIELVESNFNIEFFKKDIAEIALLIICNKISFLENTDGPHKILLLKYLFEYFQKRQLEILSIIALKSIISIEFNILQNHDKALSLTIEGIENASLVTGKYILQENIGKLYFNAKLSKKSKPWLLSAIETNSIDQISYIDTLIYGASVVSIDDSKMALQYSEKAVYLASKTEEYSELDYIEILGELAISFWVNEDLDNCFANFEIIVTRLIVIKNEHFSQKWIKIYIMCGHILGYISSVVGYGRIPILKDEIYTKPYQGILFFTTTDFTTLYKEKNYPILFSLLALFSYGINNIERAGYWALRAFDLARQNGDQEIFLMISSVCSQYSLINFNFEVTFESSLLFSAVSSHTHNKIRDSFLNYDNIKIQNLLSQKPSKDWDDAEDSMVRFTLIPSFILTLNDQLFLDQQNIKHFVDFKNAIQNYIPKASNIFFWETIFELTTRIFEKNITIKELINRGNTFMEIESNNLHIICSLGIIVISQDSKQRFNQVLSIFPYF